NLFNRTSGRVHGYSSRLASNLRFSISLRTAMGYVSLLLRMLPSAIVLLSLCFILLQAPILRARQIRMLEHVGAMDADTLKREPDALRMAETEDTFLRVMDDDGHIRWRDDATNAQYPGWEIYEGWGATFDPVSQWPYVQYISALPALGEGWHAQLLFDIRAQARMLLGLLVFLAVLTVLLAHSFLTSGRRINRELLQPLYDIAEITQRLGEKNLSERINVEGTQNELRDLAVVLNDMLDRIETGYNRQKQFVSDASHELRTPIAVIQGYANLLARWGKDSPSVRDEAIGAISQETQSMKELVENLLFLARHDKKTLKLDRQPFDAAELLREAVKDAEIIAHGHVFELGGLAAGMLVADRNAIKQAVRIFVDNAMKYSPMGSLIKLSSEMREGRYWIHVADQGTGIRKEELGKIFDRFYRADEARNSQTGGHGLGLSIARIIVTSHGGKIHVQSKFGQGSTFSIALPIQQA
ncbi:MAG: ATP-binding protein, partial [Clostridia bacterium]